MLPLGGRSAVINGSHVYDVSNWVCEHEKSFKITMISGQNYHGGYEQFGSTRLIDIARYYLSATPRLPEARFH